MKATHFIDVSLDRAKGCVRSAQSIRVINVVLFWLTVIFSVNANAQLPRLDATHRDGRILLAWTALAGSAVVEMTDRLGLEARWRPAPLVTQVDQDRHTATTAATGSASFFRLATNDVIPWFQTVQGPIHAGEVGIVLPHEHLFTDLRGPTASGYGQADPDDVVRVMKPLMVEAKNQGVGMLIECTGIGVGRNVDIIKRLTEESALPVVIPTGVYGRANFAPAAYRQMSEDDLAALFIREIREGIDGTAVKAGFIKTAASDSGMTAMEEKFLRAAGRAAKETGAAVASHTTLGSTAKKQADILASISPLIRFVWVHAQAERDRKWHRQLAARGVFIEVDSLGWNPSEDGSLITLLKEMLAAGYGDYVLLSHDAGWYQPGQPNGGSQKPFTYLLGTFVPKLRNNGLDDAAVKRIIEENPKRALAFWTRAAQTPAALRSAPLDD